MHFFKRIYICEVFFKFFSVSACGQVVAHQDKFSKQAEILNGRLILGCP